MLAHVFAFQRGEWVLSIPVYIVRPKVGVLMVRFSGLWSSTNFSDVAHSATVVAHFSSTRAIFPMVEEFVFSTSCARILWRVTYTGCGSRPVVGLYDYAKGRALCRDYGSLLVW